MTRQPLIVNQRRGLQKSSTYSLPAPVKGWNARDPLAAMGEGYAIVLENFFPSAFDVQLRSGAKVHVPQFAVDLQNFLYWNGPAASKLFAATNAAIYDVTNPAAGPGAAVATVTDGKLQSVNFTTVGGHFLVAVNGQDLLKVYNGTVWRTIGTGTGLLTSGTFSGLTATVVTAQPHNLQTGDLVSISGALPAAYNTASAAVTVISPTSFSYPIVASPGGPMTTMGTWTYLGAGITGGLTTDKFSNVAVLKRRLWFVGKNSSSAWYLPVASIGGALQEFPLGQIFTRGGNLVAISNWTLDGGDGQDDYGVFVSSEGEVVVYKGTDPASSTTWNHVGTYYIGEPIGKNCLTRFGGDLLYLCQTGLYPLSKALQSSTVNRTSALTGVIDPAFSDAVSFYGKNYGWSVTPYAQSDVLVVNIPITNDYSWQFVMNTITGAWCKFTGWAARAWVVFGQNIYYASRTQVVQSFTGRSDFGTAIVGRGQQAYSYFKYRARQKHFKLVRPVCAIDEQIILKVGLDVDFALTDFSSTVLSPLQVGAVWDTALWDQVTWAADVTVQREWLSIFARECYSAAFRLQLSSKSATLKWSATDFVYELGGVL